MRKLNEGVIYVIRHAESDYNKSKKVGGMNNDPPLSDKGVVQSVVLLENIIKDIGDSKRPKHILSSPALRAIQTALPFSRYFKLFIDYDYYLAERNTGRASGVNECLILGQIPDIALREYISGVEPETAIMHRIKYTAKKVKLYNNYDLFLFTHQIFARYLIPYLAQDPNLKGPILKNAEFYKINGDKK